jgi:hypothetical protein
MLLIVPNGPVVSLQRGRISAMAVTTCTNAADTVDVVDIL